MCGISGYLRVNEPEPSAKRILEMTRVLAHRGPDDEGITLLLPFDSDRPDGVDLATNHTVPEISNLQSISSLNSFSHWIAFGHRRFSIIDVSAAGHQPFWTRDRQVCVAFNGEIYNYVELRQELQALGHSFTTHSDTEVLAVAYQEWDTDCFQRFNGFWALSLYDARKKAVLLSRDRIGVAPLYVAQTAEGVFWSSEIKGIFAAIPRHQFAIQDQAVADFVRYAQRDLFDTTFYQGITSFPNASFAWLQPDGTFYPQPYWQLPTERWKESDLNQSDTLQKFRYLLTESVKLRLRADVPVGIELSGGMDSSTLTGLAANITDNLSAFTVSFPGTGVDEEPFARQVAERYRDRLHYTVLTPPDDDFFIQADAYVWLLEEPFHAPNMLTNQGIWRKMSAQGIRVSVNGGGGDELLAGYASEYHAAYLRSLLREGNLGQFGHEFFSFSESQSGKVARNYLKSAARLLPEALKQRYRQQQISRSLDPFLPPVDWQPHTGASWDIQQRLIDNMGNWKMNYWMRVGNKSAMDVPMEIRLPFLDYRLVDFVFLLPVSYLIRDGWLKWILRQAASEILPPEVVWRKVKFGFPFPYTNWLLQSKSQFLNILLPIDCPYIDPTKLQSDVYNRLAQQHPLYLWRVLSLALWWKRCVQGESLV